MSAADWNDHGSQHSANDYLIALLGALTFGGVGWAVGYGLVEALRYGLTYFELALPSGGIWDSVIPTGLFVFPILLGIFSAWRSYAKLLALD